MAKSATPTFYEILTEAVTYFSENGFESVEQLQFWTDRIRTAAAASLIDEAQLQDAMRRTFQGLYTKFVEKAAILKVHTGVSKFTLAQVQPRLRAELDRRVAASADLIKLNRAKMIEQTAQRFSGWASSVPLGGTSQTDKAAVKANLNKALASCTFEERRVLIDQGHKFTATINDILASDGGALCAIWHSHWRQVGYNYREDHRERDSLVYVVRGNWAIEKGLMRVGENGYTDAITKPAEEIFCRCFYQYIYNLRDVPAELLTKLGVDSLAKSPRRTALEVTGWNT